MANWATAILQGLGAPQTQNNIDKLSAWNACEGNVPGSSGLGVNNPFNTTQPYANAASVPGNSAGVKSYPTLSGGITATLQTLRQSAYTAIVGNLRSDGTKSEFASAVGGSPWGTSGACIGSTVGSAPPVTGTVTAAPGGTAGTAGTSGQQPSQSQQAAGTTCAWSLNIITSTCVVSKKSVRQILGTGILVGSGIALLAGLFLIMRQTAAGTAIGKAGQAGGDALAVFMPEAAAAQAARLGSAKMAGAASRKATAKAAAHQSRAAEHTSRAAAHTAAGNPEAARDSRAAAASARSDASAARARAAGYRAGRTT